MQVVIPMSGAGSRFLVAGYTDPKPFIKVHNRPIIDFVVKMFSDSTDDSFLFICRNEHLEVNDASRQLLELKPDAKIVGMDGRKLGPVYAVSLFFDTIKDDEPVIVSYCDYFMDWDFADFKKTVAENNCDGCVPAYTGFHPHLLPVKNLYASMRVDEAGWMQEIKEKHSYTEDKTKTFHSPGAYYFKSGKIMKKYFQQAMDEDVSSGGEYYSSLPYNLLQRDGLKTYVYDKIPYFCQWGTPEDFEEYLYWYNLLKREGQDNILAQAMKDFPAYSEEQIKTTIEYWKQFHNKHKF